MDAVAAAGSISPVSTPRMIRKYRWYIRRKSERVKSSVASECLSARRSDVPKLIERRVSG
jgi:hypothetical protein